MGDAPSPLAHSHRATRAIQRLVEYAPSSGGLALWVSHRDGKDGPLVVADNHGIRYGPAFSDLPLPAQTGWVAHAVLHVALQHNPRFVALQERLGDVDLKLYNLCADAIVDSALSHLTWLEIPPHAVQLDRLLATVLGQTQTIEQALMQWDVESLYLAIDDRSPPDNGARRRDGQRSARARALAAHGHDDLQPLAHDPAQRQAPEAAAQATREWQERLVRGHAGDGEGSILRTLLADLPRNRVPWEQILRSQLAHGLSRRLTPSWSRPSRTYIARQGRGPGGRRVPFEPGVLPAQNVPRLVLVVDVSGSVDDGLLQRFADELHAILRRLEAGLTLVIGDDRVREVRHLGSGRVDPTAIRFQGGGGTDFTPLLEEANRHNPDITLVLTDLDGPTRFRPRAPVLWAVPVAYAHAVAPFGRKLVLE